MSHLSYLHSVMAATSYVWVTDGRPSKALPYRAATASDSAVPVRPLQKPASSSKWPVLLSAAQIWELLEGHIPNAKKAYEDGSDVASADRQKWFVYSTFRYHGEQERIRKTAPNNVNGVATVHICLASTGRTIFTLEIEVEYNDAVARAHPDSLSHTFEYAEMIVGIVSKISWETDTDLVSDPTEENVKKQIKGICASVLDVYLLLKGIVPVRMETRTSAERMREAMKMKLDLEMAMQRVANSKLRLLTSGGRQSMAEIMARGLPGRAEQRYLER